MSNKTSRLAEANIDDLGAMVLSLLSEMWVMRDRLSVMEKLLTERGGLMPGEIDDFVPDGDFAIEQEKLRDRMVTEVLGAPLVTEGMGVDAILARAGMSRPDIGGNSRGVEP